MLQLKALKARWSQYAKEDATAAAGAASEANEPAWVTLVLRYCRTKTEPELHQSSVDTVTLLSTESRASDTVETSAADLHETTAMSAPSSPTHTDDGAGVAAADDGTASRIALVGTYLMALRLIARLLLSCLTLEQPPQRKSRQSIRRQAPPVALLWEMPLRPYSQRSSKRFASSATQRSSRPRRSRSSLRSCGKSESSRRVGSLAAAVMHFVCQCEASLRRLILSSSLSAWRRWQS